MRRGTRSTVCEAPAPAYWALHGPITDPGTGPGAALLDGLPAGAAELAQVLQGAVIHIFWAKRYGLELDKEREQEVGLRRVARQLDRLMELDSRPLTASRPLERRLVGNCRDFSVLYAAALRQQGIPARARCGFATYFRPGTFEDHWVVERYEADQQRWRMVDPQLDEFQCQALGIDFDPCDMPTGRFLTGGAVWLACRNGRVDPDDCGIFDMRGLWFVRGNVIRDFLSLLRIEILPWDAWGGMDDGSGLGSDEGAMLDHLADLCRHPDRHLAELQRLFAGVPALAKRPDWWVAGDGLK